jgi:preprotein translocase subunit SecF
MSRLGHLGARIYRGEISFDFVGRQKVWYLISGAILVVSIAGLLFNGLNFGVEFKGGSVFQFHSTSASVDQVRSTISDTVHVDQVVVQETGQDEWRAQTESLTSDQVNEVQTALAKEYRLAGPDSVSPQIIGPSWGQEISAKALQGLGIFLVLVVLYLTVAFEWKMAASAIVALLHDILITVGIYALIGIEVTPATVIGLLTILGYSLYDTVVVFDKVRENTAGLLGAGKSTYSQAANLAVNQTLVRSINTSIMALLPVVAILVVAVVFLGGGTLEDLALVLFVGMLAGTYSSIFIATPLLADLKEREPQYHALAKRLSARAANPKRKRRANDDDDPADDNSDDPVDDAPADDTDDTDDDGEPKAKPKVGASSSNTRRTTQGPRQQPRRGSKRRPGGKKRR